MSWPVPMNLSPSRIESFLTCPMQFRFQSIEKIRLPQTVPQVQGDIVHHALELMFEGPEDKRDHAHLAGEYLTASMVKHLDAVDAIGLDERGLAKLSAFCERCCERYFEIEHPRDVEVIATELWMTADVNGVEVRGYIDRIILRRGRMIVDDYKTGRAPSEQWAHKKMGPMDIYAMFVEENFGELPEMVRLLYVAENKVIEKRATPATVAQARKRITAVHQAIARACETDDFRPNVSKLCGGCDFKDYCPAHGGDPAKAKEELSLG